MGNWGKALLAGRFPAGCLTERRQASGDGACVLGFFPVLVDGMDSNFRELLAL